MEWSEATITTAITLLKWIGILSNLMTSHCFLTLKTIVRSQSAVFILHCPIGVLGTLRNYDGDENEDVQKAIGFNNSARASRFLDGSLLSLHNYDVKWPNVSLL